MVPDVWGTSLGCSLRFVQGHCTQNFVTKATSFVDGEIKLPNTSPGEIELNPSCSGQAQFNRLGTGHWYKCTKPRCIFTVLRVPSITLHGMNLLT